MQNVCRCGRQSAGMVRTSGTSWDDHPMLVRIVSSLACCVLAASVAFTPARAGQAPENLPSATSPPITPGARDADKAPPEPGAEKADADRALRAKGLRRQGPM